MNTFRAFQKTYRENARARPLRNAVALLTVEANPPTDAEIDMIEGFEARGLTPEQRRKEIFASLMQEFGVPKPQ